MSCNIYLVKVHNFDYDSFKYGVYAIEESEITGMLEQYCISNVTQLCMSDLVEEAEEEYCVCEGTDNPLYLTSPFLLNFLKRKHYLEPNISDVYVSPFAAYYILKNCFKIEEQKQWDDTYDIPFGAEDDEIDTSNVPF